MTPPTLAVWKLASCDGCQLTILDCEDELLTLADRFRIAHFTEASSTVVPGPYDVSLVEGSVSTEADRQRLVDIREQSRTLVAIGACATAGGIQALRNFVDHDALVSAVYPDRRHIATLSTSTPLSAHVPVDIELPGCPIDRDQLLDLLAALLAGRAPAIPTSSVCTDCKRRGTTCVAVASSTPCLGPVTVAGCGAICPAHDRGCYGCFGPTAAPNLTAMVRLLEAQGRSATQVAHLLATFNAAAPVLVQERTGGHE